METEFTHGLSRGLEAAHRYAAASGAGQVEAIHVLWGLLEEAEGRATALLQRAGMDLNALACPPPPSCALESAALSRSAPVEQALETARAVRAEITSDRTLSTEHVLLGLVRSQAELRSRLEAAGLDVARLEEAVLASAGPPLRLEEPLQLMESREEIDAARALDANANRARESLRVVEDYCRFVLADAFLSGQLKKLRHGLAEALERVPPGALLAARDTLADVGTSLTAPGEHERHTLIDVARANFKRLSEALRALEEFGKLRSPDVGQAIEQLRYDAYTLERAALGGARSRERLADARLYVLITGATAFTAFDWLIPEAAAGGAQIFQLREKTLPDRELLERARLVRRLTREAGVLFIVNDRPDIARLADADGVHLGQHDLPVHEARRIVGPDALIGVSTHTVDQLRQAVLEGASYVGVGPTFRSATKDFPELAGCAFVRQAMAETTLPAFALGGIDAENIGDVIAAGCGRVAVSKAVAGAEDPRAAAAALRQALETTR